MFNLFDSLHDKFSDQKNQVESGYSILAGGALSLYLLYSAPTLELLFSWDTAVKAFFGVSTFAISLIVKEVIKVLIEYMKPKAIKFCNKRKSLIIKFFKHGTKEKNRKRA